MSNPENEYSLSKEENKIFSSLVMLGGKTKREILITTDLQVEKTEKTLSKLIDKGLIQLNDETEVYFPALPFENIITLLSTSSTEIETNKKDQAATFQEYQNLVQENLEKFQESLERQFEVFKTSSNVLQASLKDGIDESEQQRVKRTEDLVETMLSSFTTKTSEIQTDFQSSLSSESSSFEKQWTNALDGLQNIPETGTRTLKGSIVKYENELSDIIKLALKRITSIQTQMLNIVTAIEAESTSQIREFFANSESVSDELKNNLKTGLQESFNQEKEFINEIRQQVQNTLEKEITKALQTVVSNLTKEIDKGINEAIVEVKNKTDNVITENSNQIKADFKEFLENASELVQEQRASLDVLTTELSKLSSEKKLEAISDAFKRQLEVHLSADLNTLETNYRRVQKTTTDIIETVRRAAKDRLVVQSKEFEGLLRTFNDVMEKSIAQTDMDVLRFQQISQSILQLLGNLLVSIPMRSNHFKTSLKETINSSVVELQDGMDKSYLDPIKDIYKTLTDSQTRIELAFQETLEEGQTEINKVVDSNAQLSNTVAKLQEAYLEKVEHRFKQRAKVMNTELEAIARNFQQVINATEGGYGDIKDRLSSENVIINVESSLQNSISQLKIDVDNVFTQNRKKSHEFVSQLDSTLQGHLDRTLEVIKEGFSQVKAEFTTELESQLNLRDKNDENQQNNLISTIEAFSDQSKGQFSKFQSNLNKILEENQKQVSEFISESRRTSDEVIDLHKSNIEKYQDKGTNDILSFINQIESEVSNQAKRVREAMKELETNYSGYSDSAIDEVNGLIRQVHESGEKLTAIVYDSFQGVNDNLEKITEDIDIYYTDSLTDIEGQINVTTGFVSFEVEKSVKKAREESKALEAELKETVDNLNTEVKDFVSHQDQDFQTKIPELSKDFSRVFDDLIQDRASSNQELEGKTEESLGKLLKNWNNQMGKAKATLEDVTNAINKAIEANLENLDLIVKTNVDGIIQSFNTTLNIEASKDDILGLNEIPTKVKQANKRLKTVVSKSLKSHLEQLDQQLIPEIVTSFEAGHIQTEEDLSTYIEDFRDLISSSQTTLINQLHTYLKEESQNLDFSEMKNELNEIILNYSDSTGQSIESLSNDLSDSVQMTVKEVEKSRFHIQDLFSKLEAVMVEQNEKLIDSLAKFKEETSDTIEEASQDSRKILISNLESYNNDLDKTSLEFRGTTTQLTQTMTEELDTQISNIIDSSNEFFDHLLEANSHRIDILQVLATEFSRVKPLDAIRLIKLATDEIKNQFIIDMINSASKQVTIVTSNPTFLDVADLKAIPSEKRIFIVTDFDFTKKGKKWVSDIGKPVNINFHKSKAKNLVGLLVVRDDNSALVLPDTLGFTSTDEKLVSYLSGMISWLKGASLRLPSKRKKSS